MGRWGRARLIYAISFRVLRKNPALAIFPVISGLASLLVLASFGSLAITAGRHGSHLRPAGYVLLALMYVLVSFITIFCNAALIYCADLTLHGGRPTARAGIAAMAGQLPAIIAWSLIAATVSLVLRVAGARFGIMGRLTAAVTGLAWSLTTYLVLPALVLENVSAVTAVRRSKALFRRTWGERVAGGIQLSLISLILILIPVIVLTAAATAALAVGSTGLLAALMIGIGAPMIVWWLIVAIAGGAISVIFQTALYRYAETGEIVPAFATAGLPEAFEQ